MSSTSEVAMSDTQVWWWHWEDMVNLLRSNWLLVGLITFASICIVLILIGCCLSCQIGKKGKKVVKTFRPRCKGTGDSGWRFMDPANPNPNFATIRGQRTNNEGFAPRSSTIFMTPQRHSGPLAYAVSPVRSAPSPPTPLTPPPPQHQHQLMHRASVGATYEMTSFAGGPDFAPGGSCQTLPRDFRGKLNPSVEACDSVRIAMF